MAELGDNWDECTITILPPDKKSITLRGKLANYLGERIGVEFTDTTLDDYGRFRDLLLDSGIVPKEVLLSEVAEQPGLGHELTTDFEGKPLGEMTQILYAIPREQIESALAEQKRTGKKLGAILTSKHIITKQQLDACLALSRGTQTTLFSHAFLAPLRRSTAGRHAQLWIEGFLFVLATMGIMQGLAGIAESGLISLFLVTTALSSRFHELILDTNARREAMDLLTLFGGLFAGYVLISLSASEASFDNMFGFVKSVSKVQENQLFEERNFADLTGILGNNLLVLFSVVFLSFLYRGYAVLLTMAWNACIWGMTLTLLMRESFKTGVENPMAYAAYAFAGLSPHLILEALAYILAALSAIGFSKSFLWHEILSHRFLHDFKRHGSVLFLAIILVVFGSLFETLWVPYIQDSMQQFRKPTKASVSKSYYDQKTSRRKTRPTPSRRTPSKNTTIKNPAPTKAVQGKTGTAAQGKTGTAAQGKTGKSAKGKVGKNTQGKTGKTGKVEKTTPGKTGNSATKKPPKKSP